MKFLKLFRWQAVTFSDGTFGLRHFSLLNLGYVYADMVTPGLVWPPSSRYFPDCHGTYKQFVITKALMADPGTPL